MTISNQPQFRPPGEAQSLILQIDAGCPWNQCTFCGMYKGMPYQRRSDAEIAALIAQAAVRAPGTRRVFLADGDVMHRPFHALRNILQVLQEHFPRLARVSLYANGASIASQSAAELAELKALKLHTLYMGLESGDDETLRRCRKQESAAEMVDAGRAAQAVGLRMSVMVLLGLGGMERSLQHSEHTAHALNRMQPRLLSALRVIPLAGTQLHAEACRGGFTPLSAFAVVQELRDLLARLDLAATVFRANHSSNIIPVEARLPHDKERVLAELDALLAANTLSRNAPGAMPMWL